MLLPLIVLLGTQSVPARPSLPAPPPVHPTKLEPAAPVKLPRGAKPPAPVQPGEWLAMDDYPAAALRAGDAGIVWFTLYVDAKGGVTRCAVNRSTTSPLLNSTACRLLLRRAHFAPARDRRHRAIASSYSGTLRWVIPFDRPDPEDGNSDPAPAPADKHGSQNAFQLDESPRTPYVAAARIAVAVHRFVPDRLIWNCCFSSPRSSRA